MNLIPDESYSIYDITYLSRIFGRNKEPGYVLRCGKEKIFIISSFFENGAELEKYITTNISKYKI